MTALAPAVPEPELCDDRKAGVPPGVTIWLINGGRHPRPAPGQLLTGTLTPVPAGHGRCGRLVPLPGTDQGSGGPWGTRGWERGESTQGVTESMCWHRKGVDAA